MAEPTREDLQALIDEIRTTLRDDPAFNRLLDPDHPFESNPKQIAIAIKQVVSHINSTPPFLSIEFSWDTFPRYLLVLGVCALLQRSVADVDDRNYLPAQDGMVNMSNRAKGSMVRQASMQKWQEFLSSLIEYKTALNMQLAMGGRGLASQAGSRLLDEYIEGYVNNYDGNYGPGFM